MTKNYQCRMVVRPESKGKVELWTDPDGSWLGEKTVNEILKIRIDRGLNEPPNELKRSSVGSRLRQQRDVFAPKDEQVKRPHNDGLSDSERAKFLAGCLTRWPAPEYRPKLGFPMGTR